jgi:aspartyl protease family protein
MRSVMVFAFLALVAAGIVPRLYVAPYGATAATPAPPPEASTSNEAARYAANYRSMTIQRGSNGHFNVQAEVDGRRMDFLIDTGASSIVLRESDAARLGIHPSRNEYSGTAATANGTVRVAPVELNRVDIGSLTVRNVRAIIIPDEALGQNLLGMSFLSRVRWEHRDGRLVLEQ